MDVLVCFGWQEEEVAVWVSRLVKDICAQPIAIYGYKNIQEWYTGLTDLPCELERWMEIINKVNEAIQFSARTWCSAKAVINEPTIEIR